MIVTCTPRGRPYMHMRYACRGAWRHDHVRVRAARRQRMHVIVTRGALRMRVYIFTLANQVRPSKKAFSFQDHRENTQ